MTDTDLRPPEAARPKPSVPPAAAAGTKWWRPLMNKWGLIGVIIFVGLAINAVESAVGWLFPSTVQQREAVANWEEIDAEVGKDLARIQEKLITILSSLPGPTPRKSFDEAHHLAFLYEQNWQEQEKSDETERSDPAKRDRQASLDRRYQAFAPAMDRELYSRTPNTSRMLEILKNNFRDVSGGAIHHYAQKLNDTIREQWRKAGQMPALATEIGQLLKEARSATEDRSQNDLEKRITERVKAYVLAAEYKRTFPSSKPDPKNAERQQRASAALAALNGVDDDAIKVIIANLDDGSEQGLALAVHRTVYRLAR